MSLKTYSSQQTSVASLVSNTNNINETRIANAGIPPPSSYPDPKIADSVLAQEMNKLSFKERERVYEDIHGVSENIKEEPRFVENCLFKMHKELEKMPNKPAYDLAISKSPSYVTGVPLRLAFLRSTDFDPKHAARKFMAYFENKKLYFGEDALGRPIKLSDLDKDDLEAIKSGWFQVLQFRDKAGRAVIWSPLDFVNYKTVPNAIRCSWYRIMTLLEDEENQKRGLVFVVTGIGEAHLSDDIREFIWTGTQFMMYIPVKFVSLHMCLRSKVASPVASFIQLATATAVRVRIRIHCGTDTECMYALLTFGIPVNYAPITSSGQLKLRYHRQWIARRQRLEAFRDQCGYLGGTAQETVFFYGDNKEIELPARNDILVGKGGPSQHHHGNLLYMSIVDKYKEQYMNALDFQKSLIIENILNEVQQIIMMGNKARFLERNNDGWWVESSKDVVTKKIHHRLRLKVQPQVPATKPTSSKGPTPGAVSFLNHAGSPIDNTNNTGCFGFVKSVVGGTTAKRSKVEYQ